MLESLESGMDGLEFTAEVIKAVAWPAAAVTLGFTFKRQVRNLLEKMKSLKGPGGIEASFAEGVQKVAEQTEQAISAAPGNPAIETRAPSDPFARPAVVILDAWRDVEAAVHDLLASRLLLPEGGARSFMHLLRALSEARLLPARTVALIGSMWELRGQVAHSKFFEPAHIDAKAYRASADRLVEYLHAVTLGAEGANVTELREERQSL